jgi:membrane-bound lytic murein transglycosylase D
MSFRAVFLLIALATAIPAIGNAADDPAGTRLFPRPASLEPQIRFWKNIFTKYSEHQVLVHDAYDLDKVYEVLDFRPQIEDGLSAGEVDSVRRVDSDMAVERVRATLLRLHATGGRTEFLASDDRKVADLFANDRSADRFLVAADRLRTQRGLREHFANAIRVSRRYLPEMERLFREEGLPVELTRLPLIESCFNLNAYSKVGAAGIWQFMPSTGRRFMRIDNVVDERRDPFASTRAAAQYLNMLHDALDTWPLAITAYNHGPQGLARAVDAIGTMDIATIVRDYRGPSFGFASRNFYVEFLAALEVERDHRTHFPEITPEAPLRLREHRLDRALSIQAAARVARTDREELAELNPALSSLVLTGRRPIPVGYRLRLPESGSGFAVRVADVPAEPRVERVAARTYERSGSRTAGRKASARRATRTAFVTHRVKAGQTLSHIAKQHGVSVSSLRKVNRLGSTARVKAGQTLKVPVSANAA